MTTVFTFDTFNRALNLSEIITICSLKAYWEIYHHSQDPLFPGTFASLPPPTPSTYTPSPCQKSWICPCTTNIIYWKRAMPQLYRFIEHLLALNFNNLLTKTILATRACEIRCACATKSIELVSACSTVQTRVTGALVDFCNEKENFFQVIYSIMRWTKL